MAKKLALSKKKFLVILLCCLLFFIFSNLVFSATYFVSKNGSDSNEGKSWESALKNITAALAKTANGDSVWVAAGTYTEGATIVVAAGVSLYGGFLGNETELPQRNFDTNRTIINGNNSYRCVRSWGTVDGFEVTKGKADVGAGLYNEAAKIENCKIYSNSATNTGGGIFSFYGSNINCKIYSNSAASLGGGIGTDYGHVINCKIYSNTSTGGGGCYSNQAKFMDSEIYSNTAGFNGGGMRIIDTTVENCSIQNNQTGLYTGSYGGGIECYGGTIKGSKINSNISNNGGGIKSEKSVIENCEVYLNSAYEYSGGIDIRYGQVNSCQIYSNHSAISIGGINNYYSRAVNCRIYSNSAEKGMGGISNDYGAMTNCKVYLNSSEYAGGVYNFGDISKCEIYQNKAKGSYNSAGGIYCLDGTISNSLIYSNSCTGDGGGINSSHTKGIINCTIYKNSADGDGSGVYVYCGGVGERISNCIIWNNKDSDDIFNNEQFNNRTFSTTYSCFKNSDALYGNISKDPLFVNVSGDISTWDFHLQNGSPCVDTGTINTFIKDDKDGNPRAGGDGKIDMGAYESPDNYESGIIIKKPRLYVSKNGSNLNGLSWSDAFISVKTALSVLDLKPENNYEIWVAGGTYIESDALSIPGRCSLIGGFAGNETDISQRNIELNKTIMDANASDMCAINTGVCDGISFTRGYSLQMGRNVTIYGGAVLNNNGAIYNGSIYNNSAASINASCGGVWNDYGIIDNVSIHSNFAVNRYGGAFNNRGIIRNSSISNNYAYNFGGGGVFNDRGIIDNCSMYSNFLIDYDADGAGIFNRSGEVLNSRIFANTSKGAGGGIYNTSSMPHLASYSGKIKNCIVYSNSGKYGGGISFAYGGIVENCLVYNNSGYEGGGILIGSNSESSRSVVANCSVFYNSASDSGGGIYISQFASVINSIICSGIKGGDVYSFDSSSKISYSCFSEANGNNGNFNADPLFMNITGDISTWDFHLRPQSPCIDKGSSGGAPLTDIAGVSRPIGAGFDIGAYEFFFKQGDVNLDCVLNANDSLMLRNYFVKQALFSAEQKSVADFNLDGKTDIADIVAIINAINK